MNNNASFSTHDTKPGQLLLLIITGGMTLAFLAFFIGSPSINLAVLLMLETSFAFFINISFRTYFDVQISHGEIRFENLWGKKQYLTDEVRSVKPTVFPFPYPFNPFFTFIMNDGSKLHIKSRASELMKGGVY